MIAVRRAAAEDAGAVQRLLESIHAPGPLQEGLFRQVFLGNIADPGSVCIVVTLDGAVAAFGSLSFVTPLCCCKPVARIQELAVDEACRGRNVGAQLVNAMMLTARDRGCCRLEADTERSDKWSHKFFSKHGFLLTHFKLTMNIEFDMD